SAVTLGIRPEDIALRELPETLQVTGTVELVEDLGADLLLHCRAGELRLVVRTARRTDKIQGQTVKLFFPVDKLHLFIDHRRIDTPTAPPA
ncbi:MAG: TOBE domain-containing protein, partial [Nitrospira sp.]